MKYEQAICALRKEGRSRREIAKALGICDDTVKRTLHKNGFYGAATEQRLTEDEVALRVLQWSFNWEYVSGYTNSDGKVTLRCKVCGATIQRSFVSIRKRTPATPCKACVQADLKAEQTRKENERLARKAIKELEWRKANTHTCQWCGKVYFDTHRRYYCSDECSQKRNNSKWNYRKDSRFGKARKSLLKWRDLYEKTGDLHCAACGILCDTEDYIVTPTGAIICGDRYPSIDHIIPAAKGGKDEWNNVQIMCRGCNSRKSDSY